MGWHLIHSQVKKQMIDLEEKKNLLKNLLQKDIIKPSTLKWVTKLLITCLLLESDIGMIVWFVLENELDLYVNSPIINVTKNHTATRHTTPRLIPPSWTKNTPRSQRWSVSGSNAVRIAQFLASARSLSINFDIYLNKILIELQESAIGLRTKAMKALAAIISADPNLLHRVSSLYLM